MTTKLSSPRSRNWVPLRAAPWGVKDRRNPPVAAGPMGWELSSGMLIAHQVSELRNICNNQAKPLPAPGRQGPREKEAGTDTHRALVKGFSFPSAGQACADLVWNSHRGDRRSWEQGWIWAPEAPKAAGIRKWNNWEIECYSIHEYF